MKAKQKFIMSAALLVGLTVGGVTVSTSTTASASSGFRTWPKVHKVPSALKGNWYAYNKKAKKYQHVKISKSTYQFSADKVGKLEYYGFPYLHKGFKQTQVFKIKGNYEKAFSMSKMKNGWTSFVTARYVIASDYKVKTMKFNGKKQKVLLQYTKVPSSSKTALVYSHHKTHVRKTIKVKPSSIY
ncbi:hypothetical protein [Levilactobacillus yonginensis]|uniref:hypothetical protein n=1 Tax=Levilactobacillus yonginensis TaxID=1054041 RepID=UPI00345D44C0